MTSAVNMRREPYDVYIGRGSIWGNPYTHLPLIETKAQYQVQTREEAVAAYAVWIRQQPELMARLPELRGKRLGCYCKPQLCHGDILAALAEAV